MSSEDFPRQRQVYLSKTLKQFGDVKKRSVVVVSIDIRNQYSFTVLVISFSSDTSNAADPSRVSINQGEGGLNAKSVAMCDVMTNIEKRYLERRTLWRNDPQLIRPYSNCARDLLTGLKQKLSPNKA